MQVQFSGFYELKLNESKLDELPIGKDYGLPINYAHSRNVDDVTWVYSDPSNDVKIRTMLRENNIENDFFLDGEILEVGEAPEKALVRWGDGRIAQLMHDALFNAFDNFNR